MTPRSLAALVCFLLGLTSNQAPAQSPDILRHYRVDAKLYSLDAERSLASHRIHGSGSGDAGSTLGYAASPGGRSTRVDIAFARRGGRFVADLTIQTDDGSREESQTIDLTDLRARAIRIAEDAEGRTYELNLAPSIVETRLKAKPFREAADQLYRLRFAGSRILLNDDRYIGRMLASDAAVFSIDICDLARVEFSLHRLRDAQPWGVLQDGRIAITHPDGTTIEIIGVTNGPDSSVVPDGPYQVWVRWGAPTSTAEQHREAIAAFRRKLAADQQNVGPEWQAKLDQLDKELAREPGPWVVGSGARGLNPGDLAK